MRQNPLRYLRFNLFQILLRPFSHWMRKRRMAAFIRIMKVEPNMRIIDLGGQPAIWNYVPIPLSVTILNLPGKIARCESSNHAFHYIEGDACSVAEFADGHFDIAFSNSVIEHVGSRQRQAAFAAEALRLARAYWVQTPSKWFPIEAHTGMPLWWFYPRRLRDRILESWEKKLPAWTNAVRNTTVLEKREVADLFPNSTIHVERFFGLPKSYAAHSKSAPARATPQMPHRAGDRTRPA